MASEYIVAPLHSHSWCMRRREEILTPKDGCGHSLLWLHVRYPPNQNLGYGLRSLQESAGVCSLTASMHGLGRTQLSMVSKQQGGALLSPEEDEVSEVQKIPRRYNEQRKNIKVWSSSSQDLFGFIERVKELTGSFCGNSLSFLIPELILICDWNM